MRIIGIKKITYLQLIALHLAMGVVIFYARFTAQLFFVAILFYFLYRIFTNGNRKDEVLLAAGYVTGFEVFSRMTGAAFSYEFAKYAVILFLIIGMFFKGFHRKSWPYVLYLLCLLPGVLFSAMNLSYSANVANAIGFNLSGPVCLGICALYCYDRKIPQERFQGILLAIVLPIIAMASYTYLYTPNLRDVLTGTESNFATSGGYGPNQVATVFGLAMFILFSRFLLIKSRLVNSIDLLLIGFIGYRAIITFSRGGVLTAALCVLAFCAVYFLKSSVKEKFIFMPKIGSVAAILLVTWLITSFTTMGLINKRYANEDAAGRAQEDITTGRTELLQSELEAFYKNPITGIGIGKVKEFRLEESGELAASHNEVSRMLSEHGLFGILALGILLIAPLMYRIKNRSNLYLYSFLLFWFLTISHSAMRIAAPAFIYGLCLLNLTYKNEKTKATLHRK